MPRATVPTLRSWPPEGTDAANCARTATSTCCSSYTGSNVDELAKALWYPMWDIGVKLGHAVRTVDDALSLARDDLDVATSLLSTRCVAGSAALARELHERAHAQWRKEARRALDELRERVEERQAKHGEVAFLLEPDLKEGRGGLRDVHSLWWAEAALPVLGTSEQSCLAEDYETLLATRVELHRCTGPSRRRLSLQEQDAVGHALGLADGDELMARVASAARSIAWTSDIVWHRYEQSRRRSRPFRDRPAHGRAVRDPRRAHDLRRRRLCRRCRSGTPAAGRRSGGVAPRVHQSRLARTHGP